MNVNAVVSRETLDRRLATFQDEFARWSSRTNLVSHGERENVHERHITDSLQLLDHVDGVPERWVDLGSGGGFPGLIVAAALPDDAVTLVESNAKKAAFLRSAALAMGVRVRLLADRIERVVPVLPPPTVVSARALASLDELLRMTAPWLAAGTLGLFPKGRNANAELDEARRTGHDFDADPRPSATAADATVLRITGYRPLSAAFVGSMGPSNAADRGE